MELVELRSPDFDLPIPLGSGQVFHWREAGNGFVGTIGDQPVYVEQCGEILRVGRVHAGMAPHYFPLDHPLAEICASVPDRATMNAALNFCCGLRIIRQPKWECLATFICSSMKQVAHIRQISLALRRRFGDGRKVRDQLVYAFPPAQRIARANEDDLRECALGYRARNLLMTARLVSSGKVDLEKLSILSDADLREKLCTLPGV